MKNLYLFVKIVFMLLYISMQAQSNPFITKWKTTQANENISIPVNTAFNYDYTIDWGDGTVETNQTDSASHTYVTAGEYEVKISGTFEAIRFKLPRGGNHPSRNNIIDIIQWGDIAWKSFDSAFSSCENLTMTATDAPDLTEVTSLNRMFVGATSFDSDVSNWDTSTIVDMDFMFSSASSFNVDISGWDVSNVTSMSSMLNAATSFSSTNYDKLLNEWSKLNVQSNVSFSVGSVTYCNGTEGRDALTAKGWNITDGGKNCPFITKWRTTEADESILVPVNDDYTFDYTIDWGDGTIETNKRGDATHTYAVAGEYEVRISGRFEAIRFRSESHSRSKIIDIVQWGEIQWKSFESAFYACDNLVMSATDVPNLANVSSLKEMFHGATSFNGDVSNWDVSTITNMYRMFRSNSSFNSDLSSWNVSNVTNMESMFSGASSFNSNLSNWNTSKVTNIKEMFLGAVTFNSDLSSWDVSNITNMYKVFNNAFSFNGDISTWDVSNVTTMADMFYGAKLFDGDLSTWDVSKVTNLKYMFREARVFNGDISSWDVSNVTSTHGMFWNARLFNQDLSNWDVSNATTMADMFHYATSFTSDLSAWDVSNVINMGATFFHARSFTSDLSGWNVSNVTDMTSTFGGARKFISDLSGWDVSKVTITAGMFSGATLFTSDLSGWDVSNVTDMGWMFREASSFTSDLSSWNVSNVTDMEFMFLEAKLFDTNVVNWNISKVTKMRSIFAGSSFSKKNYDRLLLKWRTLPVQPNVEFSTGYTPYCSNSAGNAKRDLQARGWIIQDGGQSCNARVTNVSVPEPKTYTTGETLDFTVNFDETVVVNTASSSLAFKITVGSTQKNATYVSGTDTSSLTFSYTITEGDRDTDGIRIDALTAGSGVIKTKATNTNATLTLYNQGATNNILVDTSTLSNNKTVLSKSLTVYPNPIKNSINVSVNNGVIVNTITVYTIQGKKLVQQELKDDTTIDVSSLSQGIYFVKLNTNKGEITKKIIKN